MTIITERHASLCDPDGDFTDITVTVDANTVDFEQDGRAVYIPRSLWRTLVREVRQLTKLENTP